MEGTSIVLTPRRKRAGKASIITDPVSGLPALYVEGDVLPLTSEDVARMLVDFP